MLKRKNPSTEAQALLRPAQFTRLCQGPSAATGPLPSASLTALRNWFFTPRRLAQTIAKSKARINSHCHALLLVPAGCSGPCTGVVATGGA